MSERQRRGFPLNPVAEGGPSAFRRGNRRDWFLGARGAGENLSAASLNGIIFIEDFLESYPVMKLVETRIPSRRITVCPRPMVVGGRVLSKDTW
jgi:hypothetical protein